MAVVGPTRDARCAVERAAFVRRRVALISDASWPEESKPAANPVKEACASSFYLLMTVFGLKEGLRSAVVQVAAGSSAMPKGSIPAVCEPKMHCEKLKRGRLASVGRACGGRGRLR